MIVLLIIGTLVIFGIQQKQAKKAPVVDSVSADVSTPATLTPIIHEPLAMMAKPVPPMTVVAATLMGNESNFPLSAVDAAGIQKAAQANIGRAISGNLAIAVSAERAMGTYIGFGAPGVAGNYAPLDFFGSGLSNSEFFAVNDSGGSYGL